MMKACASVSGGVMFIPDELERKKVKPTKYAEFVEEQKAEEKIGVFGKKKSSPQNQKKEAQVA